MKCKTIVGLIAALASATTLASEFVDTAQVISSSPIIGRVSEPHQECTPETAPAPRNGSNVVAPILGGIVGGLLGHQVGQGRGQTAATIVGAAGGAVAGTAVADRASARPPLQNCRTVESLREVVTGYNVVYRYSGRDVNVVLPYDPGSTVKVGVGIIPEERASSPGRAQERRVPPVSAAEPGYSYRN